MPAAPRMVRHSRAMAIASRTLLSLPILTCVAVIRPASLSRPRCSASSIALPSSTVMSASLAWVSWKEPSGRPKMSRSAAYRRAASRQSRVLEHELAGHRRAQAELALDLGGAEAVAVGGHDEAADAVVGLRPDDRD